MAADQVLEDQAPAVAPLLKDPIELGAEITWSPFNTFPIQDTATAAGIQDNHVFVKASSIAVNIQGTRPKFDNLSGGRIVTSGVDLTNAHATARSAAEKANVEGAAAAAGTQDEAKMATASDTQEKDKKPPTKVATPDAAHTSKLQPRLPQAQPLRSLLPSNPSSEGQAGTPLLHGYSRGYLVGLQHILHSEHHGWRRWGGGHQAGRRHILHQRPHALAGHKRSPHSQDSLPHRASRFGYAHTTARTAAEKADVERAASKKVNVEKIAAATDTQDEAKMAAGGSQNEVEMATLANSQDEVEMAMVVHTQNEVVVRADQ